MRRTTTLALIAIIVLGLTGLASPAVATVKKLDAGGVRLMRNHAQ